MEKKYREIEFLCGWNIERAVIELLEYKENGELVCGEFNGHMLYSDTVTMDSAYLEITGKNKNDFDKAQEEWREKLRIESELAEKTARENIPILMTNLLNLQIIILMNLNSCLISIK